ncbi:hypothetical protein CLU79DRAFT_726675 [Phycomyces nitens]|nr:hypothetical protein CLU79DRAFT_726675 [Phycomyces nitens]
MNLANLMPLCCRFCFPQDQNLKQPIGVLYNNILITIFFYSYNSLHRWPMFVLGKSRSLYLASSKYFYLVPFIFYFLLDKDIYFEKIKLFLSIS